MLEAIVRIGRRYVRESFHKMDAVPALGSYYGGNEVTEVTSYELSRDQPYTDNFNYDFYEVTTNDGDEDLYTKIAVKKDEMAIIRAEVIYHTWAWATDDEYYKELLMDGATAVDASGNSCGESGDCIIDLGLGLAVSGHIEIGADEDVLTIPDNAIIYDPVEGIVTPIKAARLRARLTQQQVADLVGMPKRTLENYEQGQTKPMGWAENLLIEKLDSLK